MDLSIREWLNLAVRWVHVFAGIMWIGQTSYFTWLDGQFTQLEKKAAAVLTPPTPPAHREQNPSEKQELPHLELCVVCWHGQ